MTGRQALGQKPALFRDHLDRQTVRCQPPAQVLDQGRLTAGLRPDNRDPDGVRATDWSSVVFFGAADCF